MLYEMDTCLDSFARILLDRGLLDQEVKEKKKEFNLDFACGEKRDRGVMTLLFEVP